VAFSPDGKTLVSSGWEGTLRIWDMDTASWRARACAIVGRNMTLAEWARYLPDQPYARTCEQWPKGE